MDAKRCALVAGSLLAVLCVAGCHKSGDVPGSGAEGNGASLLADAALTKTEAMLSRWFDLGLMDFSTVTYGTVQDYYVSDEGTALEAGLSAGGNAVTIRAVCQPDAEGSFYGTAEFSFSAAGAEVPFQTLSGVQLCMGLISVADVDFDGSDDLMVLEDAGANNGAFRFYVYDRASGRFIPVDGWSVYNPAFVPATRTVLSYTHMSARDCTYTFLRWQDGALVPVGEAYLNLWGLEDESDEGLNSGAYFVLGLDGDTVEVPRNFTELSPEEQQAYADDYARIAGKMRSLLE